MVALIDLINLDSRVYSQTILEDQKIKKEGETNVRTFFLSLDMDSETDSINFIPAPLGGGSGFGFTPDSTPPERCGLTRYATAPQNVVSGFSPQYTKMG